MLGIKLRLIGGFLFLLLLIPGCLIFQQAGAPPQAFYQQPAITSDGLGNIIIFYAVQKNVEEKGFYSSEREFYVQKVDKEGNLLLAEKGTLVGKGHCGFHRALQVTRGQPGEAIVAWRASESPGSPRREYKLYIAKIGQEGKVLWQHRFLEKLPWEGGKYSGMHLSFTGDGHGGVIIGWCGPQFHLRIQRFDSEGKTLWGKQVSKGILRSPSTFGRTFDIAVDRSGTAFLAWIQEGGQLFVQKINPKGELMWNSEGVKIGLPNQKTVRIVSDGSGGAIVIWLRVFDSNNSRIYIQRIDAQGNPLWQKGGIPIYNEIMIFPENPLRVVRGANDEVIISWASFSFRPVYRCIYAQKINHKGEIQWPEGGILVSRFKSSFSPLFEIVSNNSGGAIIVFRYYDEEIKRYLLQAQKVDAKGKVLWQEEGVPVTELSAGRFSVIPDGHEGAYVAWYVSRYGPLLSYVQRINSEGKRMWGDRGILLTPWD